MSSEQVFCYLLNEVACLTIHIKLVFPLISPIGLRTHHFYCITSLFSKCYKVVA